MSKHESLPRYEEHEDERSAAKRAINEWLRQGVLSKEDLQEIIAGGETEVREEKEEKKPVVERLPIDTILQVWDKLMREDFSRDLLEKALQQQDSSLAVDGLANDRFFFIYSKTAPHDGVVVPHPLQNINKLMDFFEPAGRLTDRPKGIKSIPHATRKGNTWVLSGEKGRFSLKE